MLDSEPSTIFSYLHAPFFIQRDFLQNLFLVEKKHVLYLKFFVSGNVSRDYGYMHKAIELFRLTKLAFRQIIKSTIELNIIHGDRRKKLNLQLLS